MESEAQYRARIQELFNRIETALENVDPDLAECEQSLGALSIQIQGGAKCVLSAQPSVRQLWLALAKDGIAYHFNFHTQTSQWRDDKGSQIEIVSFLNDYLSKIVGSPVEI